MASIKEIAAEKAELYGKLVAGGSNRDMIAWFRRYQTLEKDLKAARTQRRRRRRRRLDEVKKNDLESVPEGCEEDT